MIESMNEWLLFGVLSHVLLDYFELIGSDSFTKCKTRVGGVKNKYVHIFCCIETEANNL